MEQNPNIEKARTAIDNLLSTFGCHVVANIVPGNFLTKFLYTIFGKKIKYSTQIIVVGNREKLR